MYVRTYVCMYVCESLPAVCLHFAISNVPAAVTDEHCSLLQLSYTVLPNDVVTRLMFKLCRSFISSSCHCVLVT